MNPNSNSPVDKDLPPATDTDSATHQQRLVDALQGYLSEFEQGKLPDRSELLAKHPEIAEELSACLASLDFIHHAAPALTGQTAERRSPCGARRTSRPLRWETFASCARSAAAAWAWSTKPSRSRCIGASR